MAIASNFGSTRPSLLLDFANVGRLDPRVTFTRASSGTYYDGVTTAKAEQNLLLQSQTFNTTWATSNAVVTADTTAAPDGNTTADTITDTVSSTSHRIQQDISISTNTTYVFSCWLKAGTSDYAYLSITDTGTSQRYFAADFDLNAGTVTASGAGTSGTLTSSSITEFPAGSGWYRCVIIGEVAAVSSNTRAIIGVSDGTTALNTFGLVSYVGTGTTIIAWGAQLEQRSAVTAYTLTTTQPVTNYIPVLQTAAAGVARFDHNPTTGEALGLLIEEQRTNICLQSEDFSTTWANTNSAEEVNIIVAPDGTLTGDKLIPDTVDAFTHNVNQAISVTSGTTYTFTVYAKAGEYYGAGILFASAGFGTVSIDTFNLSTGTVVTNASGNATITDVGNGWYRISSTRTASATASSTFQIRAYPTESSGSYSGDDYSGIYIWGAQLEAGAFATSYIATSGSSATRNADAASMTGTNFSSWFNNAEGTVYVESVPALSGTNGFFAINDNTNNNAINAYWSTNPQFQIRTNNVSEATISKSASAPFKLAGAYKVNDIATTVNGDSVSTDTSATIPVVTQMRIGQTGSGVNSTNGTIRKLAYYPQRLTNAQLQALTG